MALENPPLLVVCDLERFLVDTNWTNTVSRRSSFPLEDLVEPRETRDPGTVFRTPSGSTEKTREQVTNEASAVASGHGQRPARAGHHPEQVAKFLNRLVFCLFAEGSGCSRRRS